ncbi:phosphoribosylglycinamide formyltransferase [bacterium]|nr:phosphoribosylglycinamide formyltransferase [bacterium]
MNKLKIGVLVSGGGTNLQAIIDACREGNIPGEIAVVISNRKEAYALERAKKNKIEALYIDRKAFISNRDYAQRLAEEMDKRGVELVCLAGFLLLIDPFLIVKYKNKIMNIHPALLPAFGGKGMYGKNVHRAVLEYGCKVSGVTVHFINEKYDRGAIILQKTVNVLDNDTVDSLSSRILAEEHKIYVQAIRLFAEKKLDIKGRKVRIIDK